MARIGDLLAAGRTISFEFSPPRSEEAERELEKALIELEPLKPSFVSVTYGAGGSTRDRTHEIVRHIHNDTSMVVMPHLTCMAHARSDVRGLLEEYAAEGLENILALAGDPPLDGSPVPGDFTYAMELIELVREVGDFSIGVAAHPECHPRSPDRESDRLHLAAKLRAVDFGITQFFWSTEPYFAMLDELEALGVETPVLPGVFLTINVAAAKRYSEMNGAEFPQWLSDRLDPIADKPAEVRKVGVEVATQLCRELLDAGVPGIHFYVLNRSASVQQVLTNLGITPE